MLVLAGCGGDDDGGEGAISKAEFLEQGNTICSAGNLAVDEIGGSVDKHDQEQLLTAIKEQVVPLVRGQLDDLRALGYPDGDKEILEAIYADTEDVLDSWEDDPSQALTDERMAPINERLGDYGLTKCSG
ncbi:MAG: hypothetical protein Q8O61_17550 [Nocardioides sp.]|nr:hypothetical protein [Nocardioides sp.]